MLCCAAMSVRKDYGLQFALSITKSDLLHFGYWPEGMEASYQTIRPAQKAYAEEVLGKIPKGTKSILEIGCGTGAVSARLHAEGYDVECVSPDAMLNEKIAKEHPELTLHECKFENFTSDKKYDLLLEMESCQYVRLARGFANFRKILNPGGAILISDTFRTGPTKDYKDWHTLEDFHKAVDEHGFEVVSSQDITEGTAPTVEMAAKMYNEYAVPIAKTILTSLNDSVEKRKLYQVLWRLVRRIFRRRLKKIGSDFYERVPRLIDRENYLQKVRYMIYLLRRKQDTA